MLVWLVGVRDLQFRRRRFLIAVLATAIVFSMTILMAGMSKGLDREANRITASFDADAWVVARGASGPFTATKFVTDADVDTVAAAPGVRRASVMITGRATEGTASLKDVNLIGYEPSRWHAPPLTTGRAPSRPGEALVDSHMDSGVGDTIVINGRQERVVGTTADLRYYFGLNTVFVTLADAQEIMFSGQPLASAVITKGQPRGLAGLRVLSDADVARDLQRPGKSGKKTIDIIQALLWIVAAGIIASIVYLTALERVRDFAVLKATGASNLTLFGALALQAITLSIGAAVVAVLFALLLAPLIPFQVVNTGSTYVFLAVVAVVVGIVASLAGLRRAVGVDPALAFGSA